VSEGDIAGRYDFRHLPFVTIDGEDAKDFDDAVLCVPREKGGWNLFVAIADVSHYVHPHMALDKEAYHRGNSVYFPGRVIPMLPEVLSNNLCSLNPHVDRLVMVCEMVIQPTGRISRYQFSEGVIHSHARLTYQQVHAMIEKKDRRMQQRFKAIVSQLEDLYALYAVLHQARQKRGAIDFDMPETKIVFGSNRKIEKIIPSERLGSHKVIEECMLSANICAAKYLEKMKQPGLYRVHEGPREEKLNDLRLFLHEMGLKMPKHRQPVPADYATILRAIKERPDAHMIQTVLLRSMSQAVYAPDNKGHFGLAYKAYTHFTSPIRRYPDLLVHRAIKKALLGKKNQQEDAIFAKSAEYCSMTERRADDATNEVTDWLKCEFMMDKVGHEFSGIISGVTNFGIFVELTDIYVEGLIHISTLPEDYYQFDPAKHALLGERTGRSFRLGDTVKIRVACVNLDESKIDFVLAEGARDKAKKVKKVKKVKNKKSNNSTYNKNTKNTRLNNLSTKKNKDHKSSHSNASKRKKTKDK
jgi:ribonuclease R